MSKTLVVAFAFGVPREIWSNRAIATIARSEAWKNDATVYTQLDVPIHGDFYVVRTEEDPGDPPPTLRIARGAVEWAKRHDVQKLVIVAAKPHIPRAKRDTEYAVREAGVDIEVTVSALLDDPEYSDEDQWYCSDSTQPRTQTRKNWQKRDKILMLMPMFVYKRVAG
ncbi:MAG: hypothetical protein R3346_04310 [Candidatus Spechtbacterales bacterium]|nr:hypothetical protein [Candidatus Spechtbacterales bacterium]